MDNIGYRLCLLDDDPDDLFIMQEAFESLGYNKEVGYFLTGSALLDYLEQSNTVPGLVVVDYNMPMLSGADVLIQMRRSPTLRDIAVAVYSTNMDKLLEKKLLAQGASATYTKPTSVAEIAALADLLMHRVLIPEK